MKTLLVMSCAILSVFSANAQEEQKKRTCRIVYVERSTNAPTEAYLFDGKQSHKVLLPSLSFSRVIELPPGDITLGMSSVRAGSIDEFPKGAPTAVVPSHFRDIYLLLYQDPTNKVFPTKIKIVNINTSDFKPGHTLWINLSNHSIAAKLGNQEVLIAPKKITTSAPPMNESGNYLARFFYRRHANGEWLPVMDKKWWHNATSKNLGFISDNGARMPKIFTIRDRRIRKVE